MEQPLGHDGGAVVEAVVVPAGRDARPAVSG
jgi:hypothetical protein